MANESNSRNTNSNWVELGANASVNIVESYSKNWWNPIFWAFISVPSLFIAFVLIMLWNLVLGITGWGRPYDFVGNASNTTFQTGAYLRRTSETYKIRVVLEERDKVNNNSPQSITFNDLNRGSSTSNNVINVDTN